MDKQFIALVATPEIEPHPIQEIVYKLFEEHAKKVDDHLKLLIPKWVFWLPKFLQSVIYKYILKIEIQNHIDTYAHRTEIWQGGQLRYSLPFPRPPLKIF